MLTECTENTSPSWNESHRDWDVNDPLGLRPAKNNGFVRAAAHDARFNAGTPFIDTDGKRAMGYDTDKDLNYYYFMASNFATSDRWFAPIMTRTHPNRYYLYAGTSQGDAYPVFTNPGDSQRLTAKTIFQELQVKGISWKIYVNPSHSGCAGPPFSPACLLKLGYIKNFAWGQTIPKAFPNHIAPISQYFTDAQNGTLPQVAFIEPASSAGLDEHPSDSDNFPINIQLGARYVSTLINGLMTSPSWKDSVFILTYDEGGGLYDHVPPPPACRTRRRDFSCSGSSRSASCSSTQRVPG
jgi:phospholipase C